MSKPIEFEYVFLKRPLTISTQQSANSKGRVTGRGFDTRLRSSDKRFSSRIVLDPDAGLLKIHGSQAGHVLTTTQDNLLSGHDLADVAKPKVIKKGPASEKAAR